VTRICALGFVGDRDAAAMQRIAIQAKRSPASALTMATCGYPSRGGT
jgi:hypothetical protein